MVLALHNLHQDCRSRSGRLYVEGKAGLHRALICLLALLGLGLSACRSVGSAQESADDFTLSLALDKSVYRPGESVVATLKLTNNTAEPTSMRVLNAATVSFFFGRLGDPERMKRTAVASNREPVDNMFQLAARQSVSRQFLLTRLTHFAGPLVVQAHFEPSPEIATGGIEKLYSNTVNYQVTGEQLFDRDPAGLIKKEEAIRVAQAQTPGDAQGAEAVLVEDETGTYLWWVSIKAFIPGQGDTIKYWVINPYTGHVKGEGRPFDPSLAADKRIQTPPGGTRRKAQPGDPAQPRQPAAPLPPPQVVSPLATPRPAPAPVVPAPTAAPVAPTAPPAQKAAPQAAPAPVRPQLAPPPATRPAVKRKPVPPPVNTPPPGVTPLPVR